MPKFHTADDVKYAITDVLIEIEKHTCVRFKRSLATDSYRDISTHSVFFTSTESGYVTILMHVYVIPVLRVGCIYFFHL